MSKQRSTCPSPPASSTLAPLIGVALDEHVPAVEDLDGRSQYLVDETLLPCWLWCTAAGLYSGKHKTTGMTARPQVAPALTRHLAGISDAVDGSRHDSHCLDVPSALEGRHPANWVSAKATVAAA